jgi:predicted branched-subunit amino acid permease
MSVHAGTGRRPDQRTPRRWSPAPPDPRPDPGDGWSWPAAARVSAADLAPVLIGLVPLGLVVGVTIDRTRVGALVGIGGAPAIFAGTAQLSVLTLLQSGAAVLAIVASAVVINARILLYGAVLEPHFRHQPRWFRWLGPHFLVDQTFALVTARDDLGNPERFRRYWLSMGTLLALVWTGLVALGVAVGPVLAAVGPVLAFAPVAVFVPLLVPRLTNRPACGAAVAAAGVTGVASMTGALPAGAPVLLGTAAGVLTAVVLGRAS